MKATERCSCGGTFEAEGRGALAALRDWRVTHRHESPASWFPQTPSTTPQPCWIDPVTYTTSSNAGEAA
jgi:hypothetical protein